LSSPAFTGNCAISLASGLCDFARNLLERPVPAAGNDYSAAEESQFVRDAAPNAGSTARHQDYLFIEQSWPENTVKTWFAAHRRCPQI
jgi:hypothetical protein